MKKMIMIAAGFILTAAPLLAQLNTVQCGMGNKDGNISSETGANEAGKKPALTAESFKEVWVQRYLSVCYPLRRMKVNSPYGYRKDPFTGKRKFHNGVDLHARGDEALAMMEGTVLMVGQDRISGCPSAGCGWNHRLHGTQHGRAPAPHMQAQRTECGSGRDFRLHKSHAGEVRGGVGGNVTGRVTCF